MGLRKQRGFFTHMVQQKVEVGHPISTLCLGPKPYRSIEESCCKKGDERTADILSANPNIFTPVEVGYMYLSFATQRYEVVDQVLT